MSGPSTINIDHIRSEISSLKRIIQIHLFSISELELKIYTIQQEFIAQNLMLRSVQNYPEIQRVRTLRINGLHANLANIRGNLYVCEQNLEERQNLLQELIRDNPSKEDYFKRRRLL